MEFTRFAAAGPPVTDTIAPPDVAALASAYGRPVFLAAYRVLGDTAAAEDVQQEVFLRLLESPPAVSVESWPSYLGAAAARLAIDRLRRQQRWWKLLPFWRSTAAETMPSAEDHAVDSERAAQLRVALAKLKPREAECFVLRHLHGMAIPDIAGTLAISENYVSVSLHRALRALESRLADPTDQLQGARS
jgi:RNA polymerase sigma factor (sigma-70 family)